MTPFEQQVIERLTRLEVGMASIKRDLSGFSRRIGTIATAVGAAVAAVVAYFVR